MDHELMTGWLSVDPMSNKYPSLSPYNYCAWNPIKLIDPNGEEINVSALESTLKDRLIHCLSYITGLTLSIDKNGNITYAKNDDGTPSVTDGKGSSSAREDLISAIDAKNKDGSNYRINVLKKSRNLGGPNGEYPGGTVWITGSSENPDDATNGLGMIFMHECLHALKGWKDPEYNGVNSYIGNMVNSNNLQTGPVVDRVNEYRKELNMAIRITYFGRKSDNKVPFLAPEYYQGVGEKELKQNINSNCIYLKIK